jgi:PAS domain S-box-containing protein
MNDHTSNGNFDRILVVDDTTANLQLLTNLLTGHGYTVYPASDGELALEFVRTTIPDLILLDIRMPGMDGFEVCRRLKANESTRDIPVIFISILEDEHDKVKGFREGAVDYITKPFQPEEVLARIQTHLRLRELTERLEQKVAGRTEELTIANQQLHQEAAERKLAEEEVRLNLERQKALLEVYQEIPTASVREIIAIVVDKCVKLTGSAIGFTGLISEDGQRMEAQIWSETAMMNCPLEKPVEFQFNKAGLWAEPVRQGRVIIVNDYRTPDPLKKGYPEGHLELVRFMGVPVLDNGRVVAVAGIGNKREHYCEADQYTMSLLLERMWEIIKRKRAEERVKENEARYRLLFEGVPDALLIADIATGIIRDVNPSACRLFARTRDELVGVHQATLHPPRLASETEQSFREHALEAAQGKAGSPFEHVILRADGSEIPIEIRTQPVLLDGTKMMLGVFRDISERKRAEEALRMLNSELEERVKERTAELATKNAELERANKLFVGRELRMVELKERIRELEKMEQLH